MDDEIIELDLNKPWKGNKKTDDEFNEDLKKRKSKKNFITVVN